MKIERFLKQFNWRFLLVRIMVNAFALAFTALVTPKIYFVDKSFSNWLLMALMLGVLNAILKPVLQFLTLQFIFVTYGLVLVLVNSLLLWLLSIIFRNRFAVDSLVWLFVGGLVLGLVSSFLENLLGLTMPVVPDEPPELRLQVEEQARHLDWSAASNIVYISSENGIYNEPQISDAGEAKPADVVSHIKDSDDQQNKSTEDQRKLNDSVDSTITSTEPESKAEEKDDQS